MGHSRGEAAARQVEPAPEPPRAEAFDWRTFEPDMIAADRASPLARELITYRDHLDELLKDHEGEFVVIKGERIVGHHATRAAAVKAAFEAFGRDPALIKQVGEAEPVRRLGGV